MSKKAYNTKEHLSGWQADGSSQEEKNETDVQKSKPITTLRRGIDDSNGATALVGPPRHDSTARPHHRDTPSRRDEGRMDRDLDEGRSPPDGTENEQARMRTQSEMMRHATKRKHRHHRHKHHHRRHGEHKRREEQPLDRHDATRSVKKRWGVAKIDVLDPEKGLDRRNEPWSTSVAAGARKKHETKGVASQKYSHEHDVDDYDMEEGMDTKPHAKDGADISSIDVEVGAGGTDAAVSQGNKQMAYKSLRRREHEQDESSEAANETLVPGAVRIVGIDGDPLADLAEGEEETQGESTVLEIQA